jgi:hypothetical protein
MVNSTRARLVELTIDPSVLVALTLQLGMVPIERSANMRRKWFALVIGAALAGCTGGTPAAATVEGAQAALSGVGIDTYALGAPVNDANFIDVTSQIPALGGTCWPATPPSRSASTRRPTE